MTATTTYCDWPAHRDEPKCEKAALLAEVDRLRAVMQSILDDADMAYYERRQGDWFLLRLKQALDSGSGGA